MILASSPSNNRVDITCLIMLDTGSCRESPNPPCSKNFKIRLKACSWNLPKVTDLILGLSNLTREKHQLREEQNMFLIGWNLKSKIRYKRVQTPLPTFNLRIENFWMKKAVVSKLVQRRNRPGQLSRQQIKTSIINQNLDKKKGDREKVGVALQQPQNLIKW